MSSHRERVKTASCFQLQHQRKQREEQEMSSDCSSGCQSGWTTYFEQSSLMEFSNNADHKMRHGEDDQGEEEEEEEDLSMVSDASSGPAQLREEEEDQLCRRCFGAINGCCFCSGFAPPAAFPINGGLKKRRVGAGKQQKEAYSSVLVDTATSPLFTSSKISFDDNNINFQMTGKGGKKI
ncbi:hypothetical protein Cni_G20410 [Canna indica]|uniref:Uncharacterized protein n=1 Tax=Canna indica TaxID=4628 RepID=A0AAQ3QG72_9LILI|nr:hypothetical protein Cni_G20410 [Canna indica]